MENLRDELSTQNLKAWKQVIPFENSDKDIKLSSDEIFSESFDDLTAYDVKQQGYDNSLKRNNAFIKKMKIPITTTNVDSILKDISELSLEKYLSEIINNYLETLQNLKSSKDTISNVRVISALHQRFTVKFTHHVQFFLLNQIDKIELDMDLNGSISKSAGLNFDYSQFFSPEYILRSAKVKTFLKLYVECYLVGLFDVIDLETQSELPSFISNINFHYKKYKSFSEADLITLEIIKLLTHSNDVIMLNSSVILNFLNEYGKVFSNKNLVPEHLTIMFETIMSKLNKTVSSLLRVLRKKLKKIKSEISTINIRKGVNNVINEENKESCITLLNNFLAIHHSLCELFHLESISLTEDVGDDEIVYTKDDKTERLLIDGVAIWDNIEEYEFYTNIEDITDYISDSCQNSLEEVKNDTSDLLASKADQMSNFIDSLYECKTSESLLEISVKFWNLKLMNKASHNRLLVIFTSAKNSSKFKYFGRFLALNKKLLADFLEDLLTRLKNSIAFMVSKNSSADRKILNTNMKSFYFFLELIKFNLIPTHQVFFVLRKLIITIKPRKLNVELINIFFEKVGRFLYYCCGSESKSLMDEMMKLLEGKANDKKMSTDEILIIKYFHDIIHTPIQSFYSYTFINEDDSVISLLNPQQLFIKKLLTEDLTPNNWHHIIFCILQLNIMHTDNFFFLISVFTKPEMLKFENIEILAKMLVVIRKVSSKSLFIYVVDFLLEYLDSSIESIDFQLNRKRVTRTRYLAEIICLITNDPVSNEISGQKKQKTYEKLYFPYESISYLYKSLVLLKDKLDILPMNPADFNADIYEIELRLLLQEFVSYIEDTKNSDMENCCIQDSKEDNKSYVYKALKKKIKDLDEQNQFDVFGSENLCDYDDIKIIGEFLDRLIKLCDSLQIETKFLCSYKQDFEFIYPLSEWDRPSEKCVDSSCVQDSKEVSKKSEDIFKKLKKSKESKKNMSENIQFPKSSKNLLSVFFKMGFFLIGHGYPSLRFDIPNLPPPGFYNMLDPPDDFRRIDLLLTLLETTLSHGFFFQTFSINSGSHKYNGIINNSEWKTYRKRYLLLITCLNYYIETKQRPFPPEITFKANNFYRMMEKCGFYHYSNDIRYILKNQFKYELGETFDEQKEPDIDQEIQNQLEKDLQDELEKEFDIVLQSMTHEETLNDNNAFEGVNTMASDSKINVLLDSKLSRESLNIDLGMADFKLVSRNREKDQLNIKPISVSLDNDFFSSKVEELNRKLEEEDILRKKTIQSLLE